MPVIEARKQPIVIEAYIFTYPPTEGFKDFVGEAMGTCYKERHIGAKGEVVITTLEDGDKGAQVKHIATEGDYIIKGVQGEFYPCKPDIFLATYEILVA